jgi:hypothetical protein
MPVFQAEPFSGRSRVQRFRVQRFRVHRKPEPKQLLTINAEPVNVYMPELLALGLVFSSGTYSLKN